MATIGLDKLYYSKITEDSNGQETYSTPLVLAKAITAELSVELVEAILYADDGAAEVVKDFHSGKLTLGVDDIGPAAAADLTGASTDDNGVLVSASENVGTPVAVRRNKLDAFGKHPWKAEVTEGDAGVASATITGWFTEVYEPVYTPGP